jgi:hypothetical protein
MQARQVNVYDLIDSHRIGRREYLIVGFCATHAVRRLRHSGYQLHRARPRQRLAWINPPDPSPAHHFAAAACRPPTTKHVSCSSTSTGSDGLQMSFASTSSR